MNLPTKWVDGPYGKFLVYAKGDCISETIAGQAFWDGGVLLPFYDKFARPDQTAIEIGAFCGQGAVYLSKKCKRVLAVEPVNHELCIQSLDVNKTPNVDLIVGAAYDQECWMEIPGMEIGPSLDNPGGTSIVVSATGPIRAYPLDDFIQPQEQVCLIKSDAQGCDLKALMGLRKTIDRCRPAILFEFDERLALYQGHSWADHLEFLAQINYHWVEQLLVGYPNNFVATPRESLND